MMEPLAVTGDSSDVLALKTLRFDDEVERLIAPLPQTAASFTALLELAPSQAMELIRSHELSCSKPYFSSAADGVGLCPPPSSVAVNCTANYSAISGGNSSSPETSTVSSQKVKKEAATDSVSKSDSSPLVESKGPSSAKRKEREQKFQGKEPAKKKKKNESSQDKEILPYVHVRARRGQATDSHSLAERARREKINARMKLLQELVPGCNKISGTALVLDEIINHVQSLQHQVELLSMKLAAVNPQIDFNLDSIFAPENFSLLDGNFPVPLMWPEIQITGDGEQYQQQWHFQSLEQSVWPKEEHTSIVASELSHLTYDYSANTASVGSQSHQLKTEI